MNKRSLEEVIKRISELGNECIKNIMTPISAVTALDINDSRETLKKKIRKSKRTFYPVYNTSPENVIGIIHIKDLLVSSLNNHEIDLGDGLHEPVYFNENTSIHQVYDIFYQSNTGAAFVVNKVNNVIGFITLRDITKAFLGNLQLEDDTIEPYFIQRQDGSWLIEGVMPICNFKKSFNIETLPNEEQYAFKTLGGFVMSYLGRVPSITESFEFAGYLFEVIDIDGNRIDKILLKKTN